MKYTCLPTYKYFFIDKSKLLYLGISAGEESVLTLCLNRLRLRKAFRGFGCLLNMGIQRYDFHLWSSFGFLINLLIYTRILLLLLGRLAISNTFLMYYPIWEYLHLFLIPVPLCNTSPTL